MTSPSVRSFGKRQGLGESRRSANELESFDFADRVQTLRWHAGQSGCFDAGVAEALMAYENLRLAVGQDVGDLGPDEVVVDRNEVPTCLQRGEV